MRLTTNRRHWLWATLVVAFLTMSCSGPHFSGEPSTPDATPVLALHIGSAAESLVIFESKSIDRCANGIGVTDRIWYVDRSEPPSASAPCSALKILDIQDMRGYLDESHFSSQESKQEAKDSTPCLGKSGARCTALIVQATSTWFLDIDHDVIEITQGRYGNRRGSEVQHRYRVNRGTNQIQTERLAARIVRYDRTPEWW